MLYLCVCIVALVFLVLLVFYLKRRVQLAKEFEQKISFFQLQLSVFSSEYADLKNHEVSDSEEKLFEEKWGILYSEVSKYRLSPKYNLYEELILFKKSSCSIYL